MEICWKVLTGRDVPGSAAVVLEAEAEDGLEADQIHTEAIVSESSALGMIDDPEKKETARLTSKNFAELSGRDEITWKRLRTAQNRYLLHKAYASCVFRV